MFENYYSQHDIKHGKTVHNTPQHNGVAKKMNITITKNVKSLLKMANLLKPFLGEDLYIVCYMINRSPLVPLENDIIEEVWIGKDVSYSHLKVFGCKTFVHVPKEQRQKFDNKVIPCIFLVRTMHK